MRVQELCDRRGVHPWLLVQSLGAREIQRADAGLKLEFYFVQGVLCERLVNSDAGVGSTEVVLHTQISTRRRLTLSMPENLRYRLSFIQRMASKTNVTFTTFAPHGDAENIRGQNYIFFPSTGHENNITQPKPEKCLSFTSHCSSFNCCLSVVL